MASWALEWLAKGGDASQAVFHALTLQLPGVNLNVLWLNWTHTAQSQEQK